MEHRFTAGEIAKLSGLSKQTILFYDKKGILKPDYVDPDNGYRYYSADQLDFLDNISMLKVLGYRNRRIDSMVLSSSHLLLPLGILLSIPAAYGTMDVFARFFAEIDGMLMTVSIGPKSYLVTILLVCLSYIGSLFLLRRKITKVNMIESLKDNRE